MIREQRHEEAVLLYKRILKGSLTPDIKAKILFQLGKLYSLHFGKYKTAIGYFEEVKNTTEDPTLLVRSEENIGDIYFTFVKDYANSTKAYKKLADFKPHLPKHEFYQFRLALSYARSLENEKALSELKKIKQKEKHQYKERAIHHTALIYFHDKKYLMAVNEWKKYIKVEKRRDNVIQAKFLMANAYETMENLKTAYNLYYSILGEYPNVDVIKSRLDSIYHRRVARKR